MTIKIPAYKLPNGSDFKELCALPLATVSTEWYGNTAWHNCHFAIAKTDEDLLFRVKVDKSPVSDPMAVSGAFTEGLWKFDSGELFICDEQHHCYQEFNLGPRGSWWSATFDGYRRGKSAQSELDIKLFSRSEKNIWESGFILKLNRLKVQPICANVSFVLTKESNSGELEHQYLTFTKFSAEKPDFHLVAEYPEIAWQS